MLRYTKPGVPFDVTAVHPDTCNHFQPPRPPRGQASAGDAPSGAGSPADPPSQHPSDHAADAPTTAGAVPGKSRGSAMCHKVRITNSIFSAMQEAARSIRETCEEGLPVEITPCTPASGSLDASGGGGGGAPGLERGSSKRRLQSPSFSSTYLHRDSTTVATGERRAEQAEEEYDAALSNVDVSLSERVVLRVICVTLPNLTFVQNGAAGETGLQRVPAVVPYRYGYCRVCTRARVLC